MSATTPAAATGPTPKNTGEHHDSGRTALGLLDARQLHMAVAGCRVKGQSPVIPWSRELADMHATLLNAALSVERRPVGFDEPAMRDRMTAVVALIDEWAIFHLPRPVNAVHHTHSLGEVISHFAQVFAQSQCALRRATNAEQQHEAALRMAQTLQGYADLVTAIRARRVQLPLGWRGIRVIR
ncbi:hypothetical protein OG225_06395 [Nocardia sp. NBC_01377]|uniref:hypothetical protein n=1 Tax=Nocardia sp. NBC_01377 TaxID=2903595 RepID=UPI00324CFF18